MSRNIPPGRPSSATWQCPGKGKSFPCFECCRAFNDRGELTSHVRSAHPVPPSSRKKRPATAVTSSQVSSLSNQENLPVGATIETLSHGHPVTVAAQALANISGLVNRQRTPGMAASDGEYNSTQAQHKQTSSDGTDGGTQGVCLRSL
ncbi:hypothetical protein MGYG_06268 [Nannizzia gypsea CBS 118893]|uniref:C2H2-type domain-containing protein n=1 Tax=Arthroderma gypseum (strain ATCC MYA-4604 / CBS 118893) TaxID=535722 RepID=E4UYT6_ARTGP|nr:hypothetical protein MGYG_06268 [Nannizzia gypsea CBS 118893]EFR03266.1 hypothetical protein MGYG_06268 [Nannizzia gypsea CBS 118893]